MTVGHELSLRKDAQSYLNRFSAGLEDTAAFDMGCAQQWQAKRKLRYHNDPTERKAALNGQIDCNTACQKQPFWPQSRPSRCFQSSQRHKAGPKSGHLPEAWLTQT